MAVLQEVPVSLLDDHPGNPRISYREDVIDAIAANLTNGYQQKYAIHVRPIGERFQVISGHHRKRAAEKAGLQTVWAWVEELDDEAAFMQLATSNSHGELSPLEVGIHALQAVPEGKRGRGNKGDGLKAYATLLGRSKQYVSQLRNAAEVAKRSSWLDLLQSKAMHLAELHAMPEACWPAACEWLTTCNLSKDDVRERVKAANDVDLTELPPELFPEAATRLAVLTDKLRPKQLKQIADLAASVRESLVYADLQERWDDWLAVNACNDAWDIRKLQEQRIALEQEKWERDNKEEPADNEPVQVLLADPPWQYDHATANRAIENQYPTADAEEIATHLSLPWVPPIADDCVLFMWTTAPKLQEAFTVLDGWGFTYKTHAIWDKERIGMGYWFRSRHELVLVATKGSPPVPPDQDKLASIVAEKRDDKHSKKPKWLYGYIEKSFPDAVKFEMYQREPRDGWKGGGNEV